MIKYLIFFLVILGSCNPANKLFLKIHPHYSTRNSFQIDSTGTSIRQTILYNKPYCLDEEYGYNLTFKLKNCPLKRKISINDTSCIKAKYNVFALWNLWSSINYKIDGWVKIKSINNKRIRIVEYINVEDITYKEKLKFRGMRKIVSMEELKRKNKKKGNIMTR